MNQAFGINVEDVICVLENHGKIVTEEQAEKLLSSLDLNAVEQAALCELDMEDQIDEAYKEIAHQLQHEMALLT